MIAPTEVTEYLARMMRATGYTKPLPIQIVPAEQMPHTAGVTDDPHGILQVENWEPKRILLSEWALEAGRYKSVLAHEFAHALRWELDRFVLKRLPGGEIEEYMRLVEKTMVPFTIMMIVAAEAQMVWVENDD